MPAKKDIIAQVYNEFYGSLRNTYNDAHKKDSSIKYQDVKIGLIIALLENQSKRL